MTGMSFLQYSFVVRFFEVIFYSDGSSFSIVNVFVTQLTHSKSCIVDFCNVIADLNASSLPDVNCPLLPCKRKLVFHSCVDLVDFNHIVLKVLQAHITSVRRVGLPEPLKNKEFDWPILANRMAPF